MVFCKILIGTILFASAPSDGWFPVEKKVQPAEQTEDDPSIWVLFSKQLGDEKFLVRLPGDPIYKYREDGSFELSSENEGETFLLTIQNEGLEKDDLRYQLDGKWVHEHSIKTDSHLYHFKTLSDRSEEPDHETFISSILIEKNR